MVDAPGTVLIVVREARNRFILRHALRKRGYDVLAARSRIEAIDAVERRRPDVILLDAGACGSYRVLPVPQEGAVLARGGATCEPLACERFEVLLRQIDESMATVRERAVREAGAYVPPY